MLGIIFVSILSFIITFGGAFILIRQGRITKKYVIPAVYLNYFNHSFFGYGRKIWIGALLTVGVLIAINLEVWIGTLASIAGFALAAVIQIGKMNNPDFTEKERKSAKKLAVAFLVITAFLVISLLLPQ